MSDRLRELQRQRTAALEELAGLERAIAAELAGAASPPSPPKTGPLFVPPAPTSQPSSSTRSAMPNPADADSIIARFQNDSVSVKNEVQRGCFLYFAIALFLLIGGLAAFYYFHARK